MIYLVSPGQTCKTENRRRRQLPTPAFANSLNKLKEMEDPGIKLFGKKVALLENQKFPVVSEEDSGCVDYHEDDFPAHVSTCLEREKVNEIGEEEEDDEEANKDYVEELSEAIPQYKVTESKNSKASQESNSLKTPSTCVEAAMLRPPKAEHDPSDTINTQQKTLKKPNKILPCPRCYSMDTKFCYYNNNNINQPRHFCKSCQRYWTVGGTMRNVPVGAGRRKNKNSAFHLRNITVSEALQAARIEAPIGIHEPTFRNNGTVLSFDSDFQLCESKSCDLAEQNFQTSTRNGFNKPEQGSSVSFKGGEYGNVCNESKVQIIHGFPSQVPCLLSGVPWPCHWNSAVPVPAIFPSGFPFPYCPTPCWNCNVPSVWSIPWLSPPPPLTNQKVPGSDPISPILGKHSRESDLLKARNTEGKDPFEQTSSERSILVPKTLRIDDPVEAAKSSIWEALGIKNETISRAGLFKGFQPKKDEKNHIVEMSPVLQANPAALSRSLSFQERA